MKKILIIDIETTGFSTEKNFIVEIGLVSLNLDNGRIETLFDEVVHEDGITQAEVEKSWIIKNSSLTVEDVRESTNLKRYRDRLQGIITSKEFIGITAYNNIFDFNFMKSRGFDMGRELGCPMRLATPVCQIPKKKGFGWKYPSVEEAFEFFVNNENIKYIEAHRGGQDAIDEAQIVCEMYQQGIFTV